MLTHMKKSKRRRYIRYAIEQEAILKIGRTFAVQCVILDFCSGGMFLGFKPANAKIPLDKSLKIQFSMTTERGPENFEIDAQAVHVAANGVGVATNNMPLSVFNALKKVADFRSKNILANLEGVKPNQLNQVNFRNKFKQLLMEALPLLMIKFFESVSEDLENANEQSEYFPNSSAFSDLITILNRNKELVVTEFCSSIIDQVDFIAASNQKKEDIIFDNSISLVEKEDFEDWLNMLAVIRRLNAYYEGDFNQLTKCLCRVFGLRAEAINNPIIPAVLCDSFRELVLQFEFGKKINGAIYNSFEKVLVIGLGDLYEQSKALSLKYGSADSIVPDAVAQPKKISKDDSLKDNHRIQDNTQKIQAKSGQKQMVFPDSEALGTANFSDQKAGQSMIKIAGKLLDILKEANATRTANIDNGLPGEEKDSVTGTHPCFTSNEVVAAISQIQKTVQEDSNLHFDSSVFQKRLEDILKSFGNESKLLSSSDIHNLDLYGKFFEALFNDFEFSSNIRAYLEKIHLPLISLPWQGNDFLSADLHPARNILNQLDVLETAIQGNRVVKNVSVKDTVDKLITRIALESSTNPDVFTEVEQELDGISQYVSKSAEIIVQRIIEGYEGKQKLETTRRAIQQEIDKRIAGKFVPAVIPLLLEAGWKNLMVLAELKNERFRNDKQKYFQVIDDLISWFYGQESMLKMQSGSIQQTLEFIKDNLDSVCSDLFQRNKIVEELNALLLGEGQQGIRKQLEAVKIEPESAEINAKIELPEDEYVIQVEQLRVGEWLTILYGSKGFEPMRLVWIGKVPQIYVFVNRDGLNKLELNKAELADLLRTGAANTMENLDVPLIDRATNLMLQKMHEKLIYNATHDLVTDLFTRDEFVKQLKNELNKLGNSQHMLCHIEVIDFRVIMNVCGDAGGKQFLKSLARLMIEKLRSGDLFARLGDKSFAILFKNCSADEGYEVSKNLVKIINDAHFQWQEKSFSIGVCMGLVPFGENCYDVQQLLRQADSASISAERVGQNHVLMFTADDENLKNLNRLHEWIGHIDNVFSQNRLFVRCQMITPIELNGNNHRHYEILLGVRDIAGNIIPPDHFIPAVERCKRMPEIDQWIIKNVFNWIRQNRNDFDKMDGFSINLSGQSINSEDFLELLTELLEYGNVPAEKITFEITETVAAESLVFTKRFIKAIKEFGCKFSLDDFGSGYSSYSYLKNLNVDYLKIDGAFVKDIVNNKADVAIVKSMNEIAHSLGLKTIAEYVENDEIRQVLNEIGVDYGQGYGIHKPMALAELKI